ncbi:Cys-tRNA(Pro) deacylase [Corynebacterium uterequi]|uniref:Cys-tRNA(Pro)/Cys-tRNA(Cys) deacylase n=1 Tax=Corynebacterium uterequi TaxID=1072256 RepID=A0A0G3HH22_9CORY|nr:Cys-tRNA(Pro) deacylase [Corynebacterium uterequi]AKK12090.1 Cys-tRNA(Pro) deacylase [Corynebacterium uterequi]
MAKKKIHKTNAMRKLDQLGLSYRTGTYTPPESAENHADKGIGQHIAASLGVDAAVLFKTIVVESKAGDHYVAVVGTDHELDLKKVAAHFGAKSVHMFNWRELKALTGYVRGGCSPIGMKKAFPTVIDTAAEEQGEIYVSAGEIGEQIILAPKDLAAATRARFADIALHP